MSIFGRTVLLMLATLAIIGALGSALLANLMTSAEPSIFLDDVAAQLRIPEDDHPRGPSPNEGRSPPGPLGAPPGPPPGHFGGRPPLDMPRPGAVSDLVITASINRPSAAGKPNLVAADALRIQLAQLLGINPSKVAMYASPEAAAAHPGMAHDGPALEGDFVAARQLPDNSWRLVERFAQGFPNHVQRLVIGYFAASIAVLLTLAWAFARALAAPIRRFSEAARRLGHDPGVPILLREGPAEMLTAVDSFNAMQGRINRLISERTHMVGAIAHDLRTPLTRLAFRLDDLPQPLNDKVTADIQEMKSMISAALDFLRDRSLGDPHERLDFRLLVERVVNDQSDLGHDATLEGGEPITLEGTPLALRRMVVNLVENALKYGSRARLRLRTILDRCVLEIDDDGPGIPEQLQQQVFEPFFRIEASRNRDTGGIGLGLATVRAIVLDHGGEITIGNRKGGGLRVTVSLALARAQEPV
jgi:two-component system OmpR family sensor kinase